MNLKNFKTKIISIHGKVWNLGCGKERVTILHDKRRQAGYHRLTIANRAVNLAHKISKNPPSLGIVNSTTPKLSFLESLEKKMYL